MHHHATKFVMLLALCHTACGTLGDSEKQEGTPASAAQLALTETNAKESSIVPRAASALVSVEDSDGYAYYFNESVPLRGASKVSDPLALPPGPYSLTSFVILDVNDEVISATPYADSNYAYLVDNPLPLAFEVHADEITQVTPQVIAVDGPLASFGYVGSAFDFRPTIDFYLMVSVQKDGQNAMIPADLRITNSLGDGAPLVQRSLTAGTQFVRVQEISGTYSLAISADGYQTLTLNLSADDLAWYGEVPLVVVLEAA